MAMGCGKKAAEEGSRRENNQAPQYSDLELELSKQELFCAGSDRNCPEYIVKVAVFQKTKLKYCTGFLTKDNVVVTASSCFPERLRMKDVACDKDVTFFFANSSSEKPTRVSCEKVLEVANMDSTKEPFLWRSDVAYLKLNLEDPKIKKEIESRTKKSIVRTGMSDLDKFYTWSVDQIDANQGLIRKSDDCLSVHNSYFNPLSTNVSSPVMTLSGCEFSEGNSGAPIIDYRGKVRGIISRPIDQGEINEVLSMRILERPLRSLMHASNFACAPIFDQEETIQNESECQKQLDITGYDMGQREMLNEPNLFKNSLQKVEASLNEKNRYLRLGVKLDQRADGYDIKVEVRCFKNVSKWINEFNNNKPFTFYADIPVMRIRKAMSEFGKIYASESIEEMKLTYFQFKPSLLRKEHRATVFMWSDGPSTTFPSVEEACPGSLL